MDDRDGARQKVALGQELPANLPQLGPCAMRPRCAKFDHLATETENTQAMSRPETQRDDFAELYIAGFFLRMPVGLCIFQGETWDLISLLRKRSQ
jgi:hypothetical protein